MKYIITESKLNNIFKLYMDATYGDVEMNIDKDDDGYIHFFSKKDIDKEIRELKKNKLFFFFDLNLTKKYKNQVVSFSFLKV